MIDMTLSESQVALLDVVSQFAARELRPAGAEADGNSQVPHALAAKIAELGVTAPVPEAYGGGGLLEPWDYLAVAEALAHGDPGIALAALTSGHAALLIGVCGSPGQQDRYLPGFASGSSVGSLLLYEGYGRGPGELTTTARRDAGEWVITGTKDPVFHANDGTISVIVAVESDADKLHAFVVEGRPPGLAVIRDDTGRTLGLRAAPSAAVRLNQVRLAPDAELPADQTTLRRCIAWVRLTLAALAIGTAAAAIEHAVGYAKERMAFGKPIASYQGVSFLLANAVMSVEASRMALWEAACVLDELKSPTELDDVATRVVNRATARAVTITRDAVQVLGGHGYIVDHPVERWYRAAMALAATDLDPLASTLKLP